MFTYSASVSTAFTVFGPRNTRALIRSGNIAAHLIRMGDVVNRSAPLRCVKALQTATKRDEVAALCRDSWLIAPSAALLWGYDRQQHSAPKTEVVPVNEIVNLCMLAQFKACIEPSRSSCATFRCAGQG